MKIIAASLMLVGAIAGLAMNWRPPPHPASVEPLTRVASTARRAVITQDAISAPRPDDAGDDSRALIRNIERVLVSVDADERERVLEKDLPALVTIDATSAGALVERSEPGPVRDALRARVARLWAARDLNGAIDWAQALKDTGERRLAAADVAAEVATSDPATALEVFDLFGIGREDGTAEHVAQLWAEEHLQDALDYVQAQEPSPRRDQLLARIAAVQAARSASAAAETAQATYP